jgi:hypothetical protein
MATKKQIAANRENAKRSTGPRTRAGRARSAMNSTRHGLLGRFHLIEGEDAEEFAVFEEEARVVLKPEGALEANKFKRWIQSVWQSSRIDSVMSTMLANEKSRDDLSIDDLLKVNRFLYEEPLPVFDRKSEMYRHAASYVRNTQAMDHERDASSRWSSKSLRFDEFLTAGLELEGAYWNLRKNLDDRLRRAQMAANRAQTTRTAAKADRVESERDVLPTEEAIDTMVRAFFHHREAVALLLRYRAKFERSRDDALHELQRLQATRRGQFVAAPEVVDVSVNFNGKEKISKSK